MIELQLKTEGNVRQVCFEPWADEIAVSPGDELRICWLAAAGNGQPVIEIHDTLVVVFGVAGGGMRVYLNGSVAWESHENLRD